MSDFEQILSDNPNLLIRLVYIAGLADLEMYGDVTVDSYAAVLEEAEANGEANDLLYAVARRVREEDEQGLDELLVQMEELQF